MINASSIYRTWPIKKQPWQYYQEWNKALFLHWEVPFEVLSKCIPDNITLDSHKDKYYVSLVAFTMNNVRPRYLPALSLISDFHEINLRTYVVENNKPGVFFLSIEGEKTISNFIAKSLSGLPYEKGYIFKNQELISSVNPNNKNYLNCQYSISKPVVKKDELDIWLTERYCLYQSDNGHKSIYEIDHQEWPLSQVELSKLNIKLKT